MFSNIKTSKHNKDIVQELTRRLNLGAENVIARIAFAYSLSKEKQLDLKQIQDAQGKEYTARILFGEHLPYYVAMICVHYDIYKDNKDIGRYVKMHVDDGLELIHKEFARSNLSGMEFLIQKIEGGLKKLTIE
ncbi:DndE family protein [Niabella sp. 22666]|uniref:DndE family protein n=1 Tax=Niabella sp. 22666 TaxID=3453954 RepID=UPI003F8560EC